MTEAQVSQDPTTPANSADSIPITVLFFSFAAERVGAHRLERTVARGTTVGGLFDEYGAELGAARFLFSVNEVWAPPTRELAPGDVVALIPPVAGG